MSMQKFDIEKFNGENDFSLWRIKMKALLVHQGLAEAISAEDLSAIADRVKAREIQLKAHSAILLSLGDEVLREGAEERSALEVWLKLESVYLKKSLANRLFLKKQLYSLQMEESKDLRKHLDDFNRLILDLRNVDVRVEEEDQGIILLSSLPKAYEHIVDTMLYGKETLTMTEVKSALISKELHRRSEFKDDKNAEILYTRGKTESKSSKNKKDSCV